MSLDTLSGPVVVKLGYTPEPIKGVRPELSMGAKHANTQGI